MAKRPLKVTDKRRNLRRPKGFESSSGDDTDGAGPPLANLFNDRRRPNGSGKRAN